MSLELFGLHGIPLVEEGDNISDLIIDALENEGKALEDGDIILIAETLISKAEGNFIKLGDILPSDDAIIIAKKSKRIQNWLKLLFKKQEKLLK